MTVILTGPIYNPPSITSSAVWTRFECVTIIWQIIIFFRKSFYLRCTDNKYRYSHWEIHLSKTSRSGSRDFETEEWHCVKTICNRREVLAFDCKKDKKCCIQNKITFRVNVPLWITVFDYRHHKIKNRFHLTDKHLNNLSGTSVSSYSPNYEALVNEVHGQNPHWLWDFLKVSLRRNVNLKYVLFVLYDYFI